MAKRKVELDEPSMDEASETLGEQLGVKIETTPETSPAATAKVLARYIGPKKAVLAGKFILTGEQRRVTAQQLAEARKAHPDGFEVVG